MQYLTTCTRSLMDRTKASDAFNAGSIPVGCISYFRGDAAYEKQVFYTGNLRVTENTEQL